MHLQALLSGALCAATVAASSATAAGQAEKGCRILQRAYPDAVFSPASPRYKFENEYGWSTTSYLGPACIFTPSTPEMTSFAVRTFSQNKIKFAVRGGGAMPRPATANIGPEGILLANTNFTKLQISDDSALVSVGAGVKWPRLFEYLDGYNVTTNGIRMGDVGVIGTVLGGGIGFFSYEYGTVTTSVDSIQCVLADGTITTASLTRNSDLFWALRGGGNNFCIVTEVKLKTHDVPNVYVGQVSYGTAASDIQSRYIQSMVEFAHHADAYPTASVEGQIYWFPAASNDRFYDGFIFINGQDPAPPGLQNFSAPVMAPVTGNLTQRSMGSWFNSFDYAGDRGQRKIFHMMSVPAVPRAMEIVVDTYFAGVELLAAYDGFFSTVGTMPITRRLISASNDNGGNPLGLNGDSAPSLWLVESPSWTNPADDAIMLETHKTLNEQITKNLAAEGFERGPYVYPSGDDTQVDDMFPGYGQENVRRLKSILKKYDPKGVFTKLLPGGPKVAFA